MFRILGQVVRRGWPFLLAGWAALLIGTWLAAPPWSQVSGSQEFSFLPADAPSVQAGKVFEKAYPTDKSESNIVLVLHRTGNGSGTLTGDLKFIETDLEPGLRQIAEADGGLAY